jgi:hypothetical protein
VTDTAHLVYADINVSVNLYADGDFIGTGPGVTGADGSISFKFRNTKPGRYTTDVTSISKSGLERINQLMLLPWDL